MVTTTGTATDTATHTEDGTFTHTSAWDDASTATPNGTYFSDPDTQHVGATVHTTDTNSDGRVSSTDVTSTDDQTLQESGSNSGSGDSFASFRGGVALSDGWISECATGFASAVTASANRLTIRSLTTEHRRQRAGWHCRLG